MDKDAMFEGFDQAKEEEYRQEARARWGNEKVDESIRRTSKYTKEDWANIHGEGKTINLALASLMDRDPSGADVQEWIGKWYRLIDERFYPCSPQIFRGLGDGYVSDPRFAEFYEIIKPGLAEFMRAAMHVYADGLERGSLGSA